MHEEGKHLQNDTKIFGLTPVFLISSIVIVIFVIGSLVFREGATSLFGATRKWLTTNFDWWFMDIVNLLVVFCLFLIVSPLGKIRLGGRDAVPEYSNLTWFAMLFASGIGIGLLFFGVLEPVQHFMSPPPRRRSENRCSHGYRSNDLSLGHTRLGSLRSRWTCFGIFRLQPRAAAHHPLCVLSRPR